MDLSISQRKKMKHQHQNPGYATHDTRKAVSVGPRGAALLITLKAKLSCHGMAAPNRENIIKILIEIL